VRHGEFVLAYGYGCLPPPHTAIEIFALWNWVESLLSLFGVLWMGVRMGWNPGKKGTEAKIIMHFVLPLETGIEVLDS